MARAHHPGRRTPPRYSAHVTHNTATVPASLCTLRIPRHQNIAAWSKETKFILFTEHASATALAVLVDRIHLLTTVLRGTLILPRAMPHSPMADGCDNIEALMSVVKHASNY